LKRQQPSRKRATVRKEKKCFGTEELKKMAPSQKKSKKMTRPKRGEKELKKSF